MKQAVLRVVCDLLRDGSDRIGRFHSCELVMSPAHPSGAFAPDLRSVRPDVADLFMALRLAVQGTIFVPQPDGTMAAPYLTRPDYAHGALDFHQAGCVQDDHRHMTAAFGASLFHAFALALGPYDVGPAPTPRIKE
jgi:hypothetical protein